MFFIEFKANYFLSYINIFVKNYSFFVKNYSFFVKTIHFLLKLIRLNIYKTIKFDLKNFFERYLNLFKQKYFMPLINSIILKEPIKKQGLTLVFDDGDDIYSCIKQGLIDNNLKKCFVEDCSGIIKKGLVNCFSGNCFKKIDFENKEIAMVSGEFKLNNNELFGNLKIITRERKPIQGTLAKGISQDFILKLSFIK
jgi:hypothetical protein